MQPNEIIRLDLPATHKYLNLAAACIGEMLVRVEGIADRDQTIYNIQLAVQEGCANIVDHAYSDDDGRIDVTLILADSPLRLIVELRDFGMNFDPARVPEPAMNADMLQVRGYGVFLMRQLMDEVNYDSHAGENCLRLVKQLQGGN